MIEQLLDNEAKIDLKARYRGFSPNKHDGTRKKIKSVLYETMLGEERNLHDSLDSTKLSLPDVNSTYWMQNGS